MKKILIFLLISFFPFSIYAQIDNKWQQAWPEDPSVPYYSFRHIIFLKNKTAFASTDMDGYRTVYKKSPGSNWTESSYGFPTGVPGGDPVIMTDKFDNLYVGCTTTPYTAGVYKSTDQGKTWVRITPDFIPSALIYDSIRNIIYTSSCGDELYASYDNGQNWRQIHFPFDVGVRDLKVDEDGNLYIATWAEGLFVLHYDTQQMEQFINDDIKGINRVWVDKDKTIYIATSTESNSSTVFKSIDAAKTWIKLNNGLPEPRHPSVNEIVDMIKDPNGNLYVGFSCNNDGNFGVFKLPKGSDRWESFNNGRSPIASVMNFAIDESENTLYEIDGFSFPNQVNPGLVNMIKY